jgi:hypothetical protein
MNFGLGVPSADLVRAPEGHPTARPVRVILRTKGVDVTGADRTRLPVRHWLAEVLIQKYSGISTKTICTRLVPRS